MSSFSQAHGDYLDPDRHDNPGPNIRSFVRSELEALLPHAAKGHGPITVAEINAELARRDDLKNRARLI